MENSLFWKNFNLGTELDIAGTFLYNGLRTLDEMDSFYYEPEIFDLLYNLSVGIERLLKVAVILIEYNNSLDQHAFEKSLITHDHVYLLARIKKKYSINISKQHNALLQLLASFYKSMRYDRYGLDNAGPYSKEKDAIKNYTAKYLGISFKEESALIIPFIDQRIKSFLGKTVGKISEEIYSIIKAENSSSNIYTYELPIDSKAEKIFIRKEYNFINESRLWKEILISAINSTEDSGIIKLLRNMDSLQFDASLNDCLQSFKSKPKMLEFLDELEHLHNEEINPKDKKERFQILDIIGENDIFFDDD